MATWIKAGFWEKLCKPCKGYKGWLNLDQFVESKLPTPAYKVYTALLTQSGGDNPLLLPGDLNQTAPGQTYTIISVGAGEDWTLWGAPNNNPGTSFVATGVANVVTSQLSTNSGAPVVTLLENTLDGVPTWSRSSGPDIYYLCTLAGAFPVDKTFCSVTYGPNSGVVPLIPSFGAYAIFDSDNQMLKFFDLTGTGVDPNNFAENDICVEIRVYP